MKCGHNVKPTIKKSTQNILGYKILGICLFLLSACNQKESAQFYTWQGIGPDKWAAVWLINRHIDPNANIQFTPVSQTPNNKTSIAFDIPTAEYKRTSQISTITSLAKAYDVDDKTGINKIAEVIHDIEVISWGDHVNPRSAIAEIAYRDLQKHYGRDKVPPACYIEFFDKLETALVNDDNEKSATQFQAAITPQADCANRKMAFEQAADQKQLVQELPIQEVLTFMQQGKKVIFVDAREANEFEEYRIPGAVNLQLRNVNASTSEQFADADLVIAYCLKDFRGFEVAKALKQRAGIEQAAIMNPYGINGWQAMGLPMVGDRALSKAEAKQKLEDCISDPEQCLANLQAKVAG